MNKEESLQFMQERLRDQNPAAVQAAPGVVRCFAIELEQGESYVFEHVDASLTVRCTTGGVWLSHADDPKNAILITGESYRAEREDPLHLYALTPVALEIEFEDLVTLH